MPDVFVPKRATVYNFQEEEIKIKEDSENCPLWVYYDGLVILETFRPDSNKATQFLIAIAEPISRPVYVHEYKITAYSLYAAASVGLSTDHIINTLQKFSKNYIPNGLMSFITGCTLSYGKLKLIRAHTRFFVESNNEKVYQVIYNDEILKNLIIKSDIEKLIMEIKSVELVKKRCIEIDYPLVEEFDFNNADQLLPLQIDLKSTCQIRSFQEICLNKMFGNGRARSGIIVLPCGSGKTLVGITAISTIKKSAIVLCTSGVSVEQWKQSILQFSTIRSSQIIRFTADKKEWFQDSQGGIMITTYSMLSFSGRRSFESQKIMNNITEFEWGMMILDEVHVVPAQMFRKTISSVSHHCKLGLTATLLREDDKIEDLNFLIGPKLYEADWQDLSTKGHIAKVEGTEIQCGMTAEFYREYLMQETSRKRLLAIMNPTKIQVCQYLIEKHEARGDKIIVFSDSVIALKEYAIKMNKPYIYGPTSQTERMKILKQFRTNPKINTIFLSKVGDTSIDLPEATCLIQISSHYGSRRQEAQRLGRVLRSNKRNVPNFRVYFYSLISKDTEEIYYSTKRQQFLIDQGYSFNVVSETPSYEKNNNTLYSSKSQQKELLLKILQATEKDLESEESDDFDFLFTKSSKDLAGGNNYQYSESKRK